MKDLLDIRKDIDKIDEQIVKLYEERMKLTSDVAEYKINTGKQVFDKEREESKLATLQKKAESDFTRHGIRELFEQIMAMSRKKQYKLLKLIMSYFEMAKDAAVSYTHLTLRRRG